MRWNGGLALAVGGSPRLGPSWSPRAVAPSNISNRWFLDDRILVVHGVQFDAADLTRLAKGRDPRHRLARICGPAQASRRSPPLYSGRQSAVGTHRPASVPDLNLSQSSLVASPGPGGARRRSLESATIMVPARWAEADFYDRSRQADCLIAVDVPRSIVSVEDHLLSGIDPGQVDGEHDRIMSAVLSEVGPLTRVQVKHARDAFVSQDLIDRQWKQLSFTAPPDFSRAVAEYDGFLEILMTSGAEIVSLPRDERVTLDSIYTRDASIVCSRGSILGNMGKPQRATEPAVQEYAFRCSGWPIAGQINAPGHLEGGDVVWLDEGVRPWLGLPDRCRGIHQLQCARAIDRRVPDRPAPHCGPGDAMHLMSLVSPVDKDLAVVYSRLLPVPFQSSSSGGASSWSKCRTKSSRRWGECARAAARCVALKAMPDACPARARRSGRPRIRGQGDQPERRRWPDVSYAPSIAFGLVGSKMAAMLVAAFAEAMAAHS